MKSDEHHDNRYEDGEPVIYNVAALDYSEWVYERTLYLDGIDRLIGAGLDLLETL